MHRLKHWRNIYFCNFMYHQWRKTIINKTDKTDWWALITSCYKELTIHYAFWFLIAFTKFQIAFTSWDIGQYVYYKCLLTGLWRHKFWNWPYIPNQVVFFTWPKNQDENLNILRTKKSFQDEIESIFHHFKRAFIEANKTISLEDENPTLTLYFTMS